MAGSASLVGEVSSVPGGKCERRTEMFDIGWTELVVVAVVMILVVGPKDLPRMLRTFGQTMGKVRRMANEFQSTFNDALREAEQQADISDMKRQVEKAGNFDPLGDIRRSVEQDRATKAQGPGGAAATAERQSTAQSGEASASAPASEADAAAGRHDCCDCGAAGRCSGRCGGR